MTSFGSNEFTLTHQIGSTSARVYKILCRIENQSHKLGEKDYRALAEGANIMSQIISGSSFVEEKKDVGSLSPSLKGLAYFGKALDVLELCGKYIKDGELTEHFIEYRNLLNDLANKKPLTKDIDTIKTFFYMLSDVVQADIINERLTNPYENKNYDILGGADISATI